MDEVQGDKAMSNVNEMELRKLMNDANEMRQKLEAARPYQTLGGPSLCAATPQTAMPLRTRIEVVEQQLEQFTTGMSQYCDELRDRIARLEAQING